MKHLFKITLLISLCLLFLSACKTNHYGNKQHKHKKHKKNCNCPKFSYQNTYPENTYVLTIN